MSADPLTRSSVRAQVENDLAAARELSQTLTFDDLKRGDWFFEALQRALRTYNHNGRTRYLREKYPGLPPDDVVDVLTSLANRYAALLGGLTGSATTASAVFIGPSGGLSVATFLAAAGSELICLSALQMRLALEIASAYDVEIDGEDPEDVLQVFGFALGIAPAEMLGHGVSKVAASGASAAIKHTLSKGTLKSAQQIARRVGVKLLQGSVMKYGAIGASVVAGATYNYVSTRAVGKIARAQFRSRGSASTELARLIRRAKVDELAFPAAILHIASAHDGVSKKERELYSSCVRAVSTDSDDLHERLRDILSSEDSVLETFSSVEDPEAKQRLIEIMGLVAAYDGDFAEAEKRFLLVAATRLGVEADLDRIEEKAIAFRVKVEEPWVERSTRVAKSVAAGAAEAAGGAGRWVADSSSSFTRKLRSLLTRAPRTLPGAVETDRNDPILALLAARKAFDAGDMVASDYESTKRELLLVI